MSDRPIVVVGSAIADLAFRVEALPMPGESAVAEEVVRSLGGKGANQAAAARLLGAPTSFVGCVGDDEDGRATARDLVATGVDVRVRAVAGVATGQAAVLVDAEGENLIAVHLGANARLSLDDLEAARDVLATAAVFLTQLEIPTDVLRAAVSIARENEDCVAVLNAAPMHPETRDLLPLFDVVVLNRVEAEQLAEVGIANVEDAKAALRGITGLGVKDVVVTLGRGGAVCTDRGRATPVPAPPVEVVDTTGAGDAFCGALAVWLRAGEELAEAVAHACRYAALAATRPGTRGSFPDREGYEAAWPDRG